MTYGYSEVGSAAAHLARCGDNRCWSATLRLLSREETRSYVVHRCTLAGAATDPFDAEADEMIFELSRGNLRAIDAPRAEVPPAGSRCGRFGSQLRTADRRPQPAVAMSEPLPTLPVHAIDPQSDGAPWLVQDLWGAAAVGVIGGAPKSNKSMLALDLAVSVASATTCLGRFEVHPPGPVLVYLAEDALPRIRDRVAQLCQHRGLLLPDLPLHVVTAPTLRLDLERDRRALCSKPSTPCGPPC